MAEYSVLIIDDDIWMQRILSKTMQSYGFNKTLLASNGFDGIALAVENIPTLIILDILMPELSGHLTLKIIKRIKSTMDIPVLMVSALSDVENLGLAVKSGTAGFISKPFTRATIYDKLLDVFGREKLEMIAKGEDINANTDFHSQFYAEITSNFDNKEDNYLTPKAAESFISQDVEIPEIKPKVKQDQLLNHYQEDEKRSLDSIKKMLLKSKK